jgi:low temperature requirement protein LtrA
MGLSAAVILGSGFLPAEPRLVIWAGFTVAWLGGLLISGHRESGISLATTATDSLVERFGTFVIILLLCPIFLSVIRSFDQGIRHIV